MRRCRKYIVKSAFEDFLPQTSDFEIVEESIHKLKDGEFLVKAEYISVDPYMRSFANSFRVPYDQFGFQVGKVVESRNGEYPTDSYVVSHSGWRDYATLNGEPDEMFQIKPYKPLIDNLPLSYAVGALGMPGITAYLGLLEICKPKTGDVVCVTSAAGAVGSLVGQIAKLLECTVIAFTGSDQKVEFLKHELEFPHVYNYKTEMNIKDNLKSIAPNGIDCFFDTVGGDLSTNIIQCMKEHGQVAVCGSISTYGKTKSKRRISKMPVNVNVTEFSFTQWDWPIQYDALKQIKKWLQNGDIKVKETVTNGFEQLPNAFVGMLKGENIGKAVVKI